MVVLFDLDEETAFSGYKLHAENDAFVDLHHQLTSSLSRDAQSKSVGHDAEGNRPSSNVNGFSAALSCYPVVSQLASYIDLTTLHNLSRTCRQFRVTLLQNRNQLITRTLRCSNEDKPASSTLADRFRESHGAWMGSSLASYSGRITTGKIGRCAADMVSECRRCGVRVCRNCTTKPPPSNLLNGRFRRICGTCHRAPITRHTIPPAYRAASISGSPPRSTRTTPSPEPIASTPTTPGPTPVTQREEIPDPFFYDGFARTPCTCEDMLWLCQACGRSLRSDDTAYARTWTWRTKYTTYLGGLGTGIGEGNEGVACGRGASCLAARTVEQEVDLSADELAEQQREMEKVEAEGSARSWRGGSWNVQECEGIGGAMRKKMKRMVKVGATVKEFEDEREGGCEPLWREKQKDRRSWCAWCERIVLSKSDIAMIAEQRRNSQR